MASKLLKPPVRKPTQEDVTFAALAKRLSLAEEEKAVKGPEQTPDTKALTVWERKQSAKPKTTVVRCLVIDKENHWHAEARVDLKGADTANYTWGYYGSGYPVLIEQPNGDLQPFHLPDVVGESSNRLYKAANPDGFRASFKHRGNLLQKIQTGLMVALILGLFAICYILIGYK